MQQSTFVQVGVHLVNLDAVSSAHWDKDTLFVHLAGGRWLKLDAHDGAELWQLLTARVTNRPTQPAAA